MTGAVNTSGTEACIAPGSPEEDAECDWSAEGSGVEVVHAVPASQPFLEPEMTVEGEEDTLMSVGVETKEESPPAENSTGSSADAPMETDRRRTRTEQGSGTAGPYWGGPFLRACFFLRFEVQKRPLLCHIVLLQFP